jgi:hypothetical protein
MQSSFQSLSSSSSPCVLLVETTACVVERRRIECERTCVYCGRRCRMHRHEAFSSSHHSQHSTCHLPASLRHGYLSPARPHCRLFPERRSGTSATLARVVLECSLGLVPYRGRRRNLVRVSKNTASDPNPQLLHAVALTSCYSGFASSQSPGFSILSIALNSRYCKTQRFRNWMFPSSGEGRQIPTLLGPSERANFNHKKHLLCWVPQKELTSITGGIFSVGSLRKS